MENKIMEYKREYSEDMRKTVIAFANTDGGQILIGVEDNGEIVGVNDPQDDILRITNVIRDSIRPDVALFVDCRVQLMEDRQMPSGCHRPPRLYCSGRW